MYITVTIGVVIAAIALWLLVWKKKRKSWCVMFYFVSRLPRTTTAVNWPDPVTGLPPGASLDAKLADVLQTLDGLPCASLWSCFKDHSWNDVHVVYRAVWDDVGKAPDAKVVSWKAGAPSTNYFASENYDPYSINLTDDLQFFFDWAFDNCPADHYAVFFWGHSFGPGGLFEVAEKPIVAPPPPSSPGPYPPPPPPPPASPAPYPAPPPPLYRGTMEIRRPERPLTFTSLGLRDFGLTLRSLVERRQVYQPDAAAAGQSLKVEAVFFQDCWMSTLETAYELQNAARYIIGSQSLVPIGYDKNHQPGAIWPYADLIGALLSQQNYPDSLLQILETFFDGTTLPAGADPEFNRYPNPTIPYALLDLGPNPDDISTALTPCLVQLVTALDIATLGKAGRHKLIGQPAAGQLFKFSTPIPPATTSDLIAGDIALIDVPMFCQYLQNTAAWPAPVLATLSAPEVAAISAAAASLQTALNTLPLVKSSFESVSSTGPTLGFGGIGVFYSGGVKVSASDPYLVQHVAFNYYKGLEFALATTALLPTGDQTSWTKIAFE